MSKPAFFIGGPIGGRWREVDFAETEYVVYTLEPPLVEPAYMNRLEAVELLNENVHVYKHHKFIDVDGEPVTLYVYPGHTLREVLDVFPH